MRKQPSRPQGTTSVFVDIDSSLVKQLKQAALDQNTSLSQLVRQAVAEYIGRQEESK